MYVQFSSWWNWSGDCIKWAFWVKPSGETILENAWKFLQQWRWISTWKSLCATMKTKSDSIKVANTILLSESIWSTFQCSFVSLALFIIFSFLSLLFSFFFFPISFFLISFLIFVCGRDPVTLNGTVCDYVWVLSLSSPSSRSQNIDIKVLESIKCQKKK